MDSDSESVKKTTSRLRRIRMKKSDSAFVYAVFEAHEGICSYSTLPLEAGAAHLEMLLRIPPGQDEAVEQVLKQLGDRIYEIV